MPGYLLEKTSKWKKEGSHNMSIYHKLNDVHKSDSRLGAARPHASRRHLSSSPHFQAGSGPEAQR